MPDPRPPDPHRALRLLHDDVDRRARAIASRHGARLQCRRGCADCCLDDLTVHPIEAERIRRAHPTLLRDGEPHPPGACAFLGAERECRIHADRPYVCRTQGLPLRWLEEDAAGEVRERRDICPLNETGPALATLAESDCWWIGPTELELQRLQDDVGADERIALRALFKQSR